MYGSDSTPLRAFTGLTIQDNTSVPDIHPFAQDLFIIDGRCVRDMGLTFTTRMTVVKLRDGSLWVNSPVSVSSDVLKRITELGPVRYLLAATPRHFWRLAAWHKLFPEAELWASRTTPLTLKKAQLPSTRILGDDPPQSWAADFDQLAFKGNPLIEEVVFFHKQARTIIMDDLIQIHPMVKGKVLRNSLFKVAGVASPQGGVPLDMRLFFLNRNQARRSLEKLLSWDFDKLVIAHGECLEKGAKPFVERAFQWLARPAIR